MTKKTCMHIVVVGFGLVVVTLFIAAAGLDMIVSEFFYVPGSGFVYANRQPWHALYHYGEWPALLTAGGALAALIISFFRLHLRPHRPTYWFLLLLYLIGPGLLVNAVLKDHWGRPRPVQIEAFGGGHPFSQPWQKQLFSDGRSFPSGHASVAFYMMASYFVLRRTRKKAAWA